MIKRRMLMIRSDSKGARPDDEENTEAPTQPAAFAIDEGIPLLSGCSNTAERTMCLQSLATDTAAGRTFIRVVKMADALEVSLIPVIQSSL